MFIFKLSINFVDLFKINSAIGLNVSQVFNHTTMTCFLTTMRSINAFIAVYFRLGLCVCDLKKPLDLFIKRPLVRLEGDDIIRLGFTYSLGDVLLTAPRLDSDDRSL